MLEFALSLLNCFARQICRSLAVQQFSTGHAGVSALREEPLREHSAAAGALESLDVLEWSPPGALECGQSLPGTEPAREALWLRI